MQNTIKTKNNAPKVFNNVVNNNPILNKNERKINHKNNILESY